MHNTMQSVIVDGVYIVHQGNEAAPCVLLSDKNCRVIPIFIGLWEAISIQVALRGEVNIRPNTHDLLLRIMEDFEISLISVCIDSLETGVFYASMSVKRGETEVAVDCRPSDGIAIAVRTNCPIFIDPVVLSGTRIGRSDMPPLEDISEYFR